MAYFPASGKVHTDDNSKKNTVREITVKLITDHNIPNRSFKSGDEIAEALVKLSHIRLDRLQISKIENLECLGPVTNLYLQQNCIDYIENLDVLTNLRFLTLSGNRIGKIQNLKVMKQLKFLDLSFNYIEDCDPDELPPSLFILSLEGNPCADKENYRSAITATLTNLKELDGIPVNGSQDGKYSSNSSDEDNIYSDDEHDEENVGDIEEGSILKDCAEDILARAKVRSVKQTEQHNERMAELQVSR